MINNPGDNALYAEHRGLPSRREGSVMSPHLHVFLFGRRINSFHFFGIIGYIAGLLLGIWLAYQLGLSIALVCLMAGVGAAVFILLTLFIKRITGKETIVYYHHEISILAFCAVSLFIAGAPVLPYIDITVLGIGTFLAFGRIGCYSVGCCHGKPYRHGTRYGQQHVDAGFTWYYKDIPLAPVQLIESAYVFFTVGVGIFLLLQQAVPGTILIWYTVVYGLMRYLMEFMRGDPDRPLWYGLSEAQWTTLALVVITYAFSVNDWLPGYGWHMAILMIIMTISLVVFFHHRNRVFSHPRHVRQMAEALDALDIANAQDFHHRNKPISIYTTRMGLRLSCDNWLHGQKSSYQYTLSSKNNPGLDRATAMKLGEQIAILKNHRRNFEIIERERGIYHLLFINDPSTDIGQYQF